MHGNAELAVMIDVAMVGDFLFNAFAHDELLAECLAGCVAGVSPTSVYCFNSCLVTGLVVKLWAGIFKCAMVTTEIS